MAVAETLLRRESVETEFGPVEVLKAARAPYECHDPQAPALLLLPGMGMDARGFIRQLPLGALAELHMIEHTIQPAQPASGENGLGAFACYVEAYITAHKLDRRPGGIVLAGTSMGGALSLAIAARGRVKLRGLALIGTFGSWKQLQSWKRIATSFGWTVPSWLLRRCARPMLANTNLLGRFSREEADWMVPTPRFTRAYFQNALRALQQMDQLDAAKKLSIPTLVLHGTDDIVLPHRAGVELAGAIPGARFASIERANHALFLTHSEAVNNAIAEFIRTLPAHG